MNSNPQVPLGAALEDEPGGRGGGGGGGGEAQTQAADVLGELMRISALNPFMHRPIIQCSGQRSIQSLSMLQIPHLYHSNNVALLRNGKLKCMTCYHSALLVQAGKCSGGHINPHAATDRQMSTGLDALKATDSQMTAI